MKMLFIILIAVFSFAFSFSQVSFEQKDVSYYKMNGKVKQFTLRDSKRNDSHKFDEKGREVEMQKYVANNMILIADFSSDKIQAYVMDTGFNKLWDYEQFENYETHEVYETWTNVLTNEDKTSVFMYSDDKKILSEAVLRPVFNGETDFQHYTCSYFYNENGYLERIQKTDMYNNQVIVEDLICDRRGNLVKKNVNVKYTDPKSKRQKKYYVKYDKKGNEFERGLSAGVGFDKQKESKIKYNCSSEIKKLKLYCKQGNASVIKNKYVKNNLTESLFTLPDGTKYYLLINKYDENGNIIYSSIQYPDNPELSSNMQYEYVYDANKNWIKQSLSVEGKASSIIERDIKYY